MEAGAEAIRSRSRALRAETEKLLSTLQNEQNHAQMLRRADSIERAYTNSCGRWVVSSKSEPQAFDACLLANDTVMWMLMYAVASGDSNFQANVVDGARNNLGDGNMFRYLLDEILD